jgi:hypothetical protein
MIQQRELSPIVQPMSPSDSPEYMACRRRDVHLILEQFGSGSGGAVRRHRAQRDDAGHRDNGRSSSRVVLLRPDPRGAGSSRLPGQARELAIWPLCSLADWAPCARQRASFRMERDEAEVTSAPPVRLADGAWASSEQRHPGSRLAENAGWKSGRTRRRGSLRRTGRVHPRPLYSFWQGDESAATGLKCRLADQRWSHRAARPSSELPSVLLRLFRLVHQLRTTHNESR